GTTTITSNSSNGSSYLRIGNGGTTGTLGGGDVIFAKGGQTVRTRLEFNRSDNITVANNFVYKPELSALTSSVKAIVLNMSQTGNVEISGNHDLSGNRVQFSSYQQRLILSGVISSD